MRIILVTGAAGFLGTHLCLRLLQDKEASVVGIDSLISGSKKNLDDLVKNKNFKFIKQDICQPLNLKGKIDQIYNLACPASPPDYQKYPLETLMTCSVGVKNLLDLAVGKKAKFLHTSTSEVYGDPLEHPQKESYWGHVNPIGERSCYDEGKRFAESLIENYRKKFNLETKIVRIFNTYGPRMRAWDGRVVSNFINQALQGKDLTVYGDGSQTRSFCFVEDMVEGLIKMMNSQESGPINLGNPNEFTVKRLAQLVITKVNPKLKMVFNPLPKDDPQKRKPDISLAKEVLGWQPKTQLEKGIEKTIEYFKKER